MSDVCRRCKAPILWARTEAGRPMPLDATPDDGGNVAVVDGIALVLPRAVRERLRANDARINERRMFYRSHFATCPYADDFRKGRT